MSAFEKLPLEIRRKVYDELLKAVKVRQSPDPNRVKTYLTPSVADARTLVHREALDCKYDFQTAILRVNKKLHNEALDTLYENHFVVVSCSWSVVGTGSVIGMFMQDYDVSAIAATKPKLVANFKKHALRLHVNLPSGRSLGRNKSKLKVEETFILVADELPRFVRMLRILQARDPASDIKICFRIEATGNNPPPLRVQQLVLEPFKALKFGQRRLTLMGLIEPTCARSLIESVAPEVNWVRAWAWESYDLMLSIARAGDEAFRLGSFGCARSKYSACQDLFGALLQIDPHLFTFVDDGFYQSCLQVTTVCLRNFGLCGLRMECWDAVAKGVENTGLGDPVHSTYTNSLGFHCFGVALAAKNMDKKALEVLKKAEMLDPENDLLRNHVSITLERLAAKTEAAKTAAGTIYSAASLRHLGKLAIVPPPILTTSRYIAGERYVLRHFGYTGNLLEGIRETAPANVKEMKEIIRKMEKDKANTPSGEFDGLWLGARG